MRRTVVRVFGVGAIFCAIGFFGSGLVSAEELNTSNSVEVRMEIPHILEVTFPDAPTVPLAVDPASADGYNELDLNVDVATNSPAGYKLYMYANSPDLVNSADSSMKITSLSTAETFDDVDVAWGFKIRDSMDGFAPIPLGFREFKVNETSAPSQDRFVFTFGVKAKGASVASGLYTGTINFEVVAN